MNVQDRSNAKRKLTRDGAKGLGWLAVGGQTGVGQGDRARRPALPERAHDGVQRAPAGDAMGHARALNREAAA